MVNELGIPLDNRVAIVGGGPVGLALSINTSKIPYTFCYF